MYIMQGISATHRVSTTSGLIRALEQFHQWKTSESQLPASVTHQLCVLAPPSLPPSLPAYLPTSLPTYPPTIIISSILGHLGDSLFAQSESQKPRQMFDWLYVYIYLGFNMHYVFQNMVTNIEVFDIYKIS